MNELVNACMDGLPLFPEGISVFF